MKKCYLVVIICFLWVTPLAGADTDTIANCPPPPPATIYEVKEAVEQIITLFKIDLVRGKEKNDEVKFSAKLIFTKEEKSNKKTIIKNETILEAWSITTIGEDLPPIEKLISKKASTGELAIKFTAKKTNMPYQIKVSFKLDENTVKAATSEGIRAKLDPNKFEIKLDTSPDLTSYPHISSVLSETDYGDDGVSELNGIRYKMKESSLNSGRLGHLAYCEFSVTYNGKSLTSVELEDRYNLVLSIEGCGDGSPETADSDDKELCVIPKPSNYYLGVPVVTALLTNESNDKVIKEKDCTIPTHGQNPEGRSPDGQPVQPLKLMQFKQMPVI